MKIKKFRRVLKKKLKPLIAAKKLNMGKISKKLGLNLMMISENGKFYPQLFLDDALYEL